MKKLLMLMAIFVGIGTAMQIVAVADQIETCDILTCNPSDACLNEPACRCELADRNACGGCGDAQVERCDGVDNNCNGTIDEGVTNACGTCGEVPAEVCDGQDNDCDGSIDEGMQLNACGTCGETPTETCDGIDNDCDGSTDEGLLNACGTCGETPTETCDGVDNDCDGSTDEGLLNACGTCGETPTETCDGVDNDCDGSTDEGLLNACGTCGETPIEVCDGRDNDCDGSVDEDFQELGSSCSVGVGVCANAGTVVCGDSKSQTVCSAQPLSPSDEVCDGQDNDCDGSIDEDFTTLGTSCNVGVGECTNAGTVVCGEDGSTTCNTKPLSPSDEVCDGLDNDCDGSTDEDFETLGSSCSVGVGACSEAGTIVCGKSETQVVCDASPGKPSAEVCDEVDNDCDGTVDENVCSSGGFPGGGTPSTECPPFAPVRCANARCAATSSACVAQNSQPVSSDTVDQDCDGDDCDDQSVDEGPGGGTTQNYCDGFRCADGSCAASADACSSVAVCPSSSPILCPDNTCNESLTQCVFTDRTLSSQQAMIARVDSFFDVLTESVGSANEAEIKKYNGHVTVLKIMVQNLMNGQATDSALVKPLQTLYRILLYAEHNYLDPDDDDDSVPTETDDVSSLSSSCVESGESCGERLVLDGDVYEQIGGGCGSCPETKTCEGGSTVNCTCLNNEFCMCQLCPIVSKLEPIPETD